MFKDDRKAPGNRHRSRQHASVNGAHHSKVGPRNSALPIGTAGASLAAFETIGYKAAQNDDSELRGNALANWINVAASLHPPHSREHKCMRLFELAERELHTARICYDASMEFRSRIKVIKPSQYVHLGIETAMMIAQKEGDENRRLGELSNIMYGSHIESLSIITKCISQLKKPPCYVGDGIDERPGSLAWHIAEGRNFIQHRYERVAGFDYGVTHAHHDVRGDKYFQFSSAKGILSLPIGHSTVDTLEEYFIKLFERHPDLVRGILPPAQSAKPDDKVSRGPKYDERGEVRYLCDKSGFVMVARGEDDPFVMSEKDWRLMSDCWPPSPK